MGYIFFPLFQEEGGPGRSDNQIWSGYIAWNSQKINKNIISWENITLGALKASLGHMSRPCFKIKQEEYPILNEYYWVVNIFWKYFPSVLASKIQMKEDEGVVQK